MFEITHTSEIGQAAIAAFPNYSDVKKRLDNLTLITDKVEQYKLVIAKLYSHFLPYPPTYAALQKSIESYGNEYKKIVEELPALEKADVEFVEEMKRKSAAVDRLSQLPKIVSPNSSQVREEGRKIPFYNSELKPIAKFAEDTTLPSETLQTIFADLKKALQGQEGDKLFIDEMIVIRAKYAYFNEKLKQIKDYFTQLEGLIPTDYIETVKDEHLITAINKAYSNRKEISKLYQLGAADPKNIKKIKDLYHQLQNRKLFDKIYQYYFKELIEHYKQLKTQLEELHLILANEPITSEDSDFNDLSELAEILTEIHRLQAKKVDTTVSAKQTTIIPEKDFILPTFTDWQQLKTLSKANIEELKDLLIKAKTTTQKINFTAPIFIKLSDIHKNLSQLNKLLVEINCFTATSALINAPLVKKLLTIYSQLRTNLKDQPQITDANEAAIHFTPFSATEITQQSLRKKSRKKQQAINDKAKELLTKLPLLKLLKRLVDCKEELTQANFPEAFVRRQEVENLINQIDSIIDNFETHASKDIEAATKRVEANKNELIKGVQNNIQDGYALLTMSVNKTKKELDQLNIPKNAKAEFKSQLDKLTDVKSSCSEDYQTQEQNLQAHQKQLIEIQKAITAEDERNTLSQNTLILNKALIKFTSFLNTASVPESNNSLYAPLSIVYHDLQLIYKMVSLELPLPSQDHTRGKYLSACHFPALPNIDLSAKNKEFLNELNSKVIQCSQSVDQNTKELTQAFFNFILQEQKFQEIALKELMDLRDNLNKLFVTSEETVRTKCNLDKAINSKKDFIKCEQSKLADFRNNSDNFIIAYVESTNPKIQKSVSNFRQKIQKYIDTEQQLKQQIKKRIEKSVSLQVISTKLFDENKFDFHQFITIFDNILKKHQVPLTTIEEEFSKFDGEVNHFIQAYFLNINDRLKSIVEKNKTVIKGLWSNNIILTSPLEEKIQSTTGQVHKLQEQLACKKNLAQELTAEDCCLLTQQLEHIFELETQLNTEYQNIILLKKQWDILERQLWNDPRLEPQQRATILANANFSDYCPNAEHSLTINIDSLVNKVQILEEALKKYQEEVQAAVTKTTEHQQEVVLKEDQEPDLFGTNESDLISEKNPDVFGQLTSTPAQAIIEKNSRAVDLFQENPMENLPENQDNTFQESFVAETVSQADIGQEPHADLSFTSSVAAANKPEDDLAECSEVQTNVTNIDKGTFNSNEEDIFGPTNTSTSSSDSSEPSDISNVNKNNSQTNLFDNLFDDIFTPQQAKDSLQSHLRENTAKPKISSAKEAQKLHDDKIQHSFPEEKQCATSARSNSHDDQKATIKKKASSMAFFKDEENNIFSTSVHKSATTTSSQATVSKQSSEKHPQKNHTKNKEKKLPVSPVASKLVQITVAAACTSVVEEPSNNHLLPATFDKNENADDDQALISRAEAILSRIKKEELPQVNFYVQHTLQDGVKKIANALLQQKKFSHENEKIKLLRNSLIILSDDLNTHLVTFNTSKKQDIEIAVNTLLKNINTTYQTILENNIKKLDQPYSPGLNSATAENQGWRNKLKSWVYSLFTLCFTHERKQSLDPDNEKLSNCTQNLYNDLEERRRKFYEQFKERQQHGRAITNTHCKTVNAELLTQRQTRANPTTANTNKSEKHPHVRYESTRQTKKTSSNQQTSQDPNAFVSQETIRAIARMRAAREKDFNPTLVTTPQPSFEEETSGYINRITY